MLPLATFAATAAVGVGKSIAGSLLADVAGAKAKSSVAGGSAVEGAANPAQTKARKAATEFEAMFLEQNLDRLMQSEGSEGPLGENGTGGGVWRSMLSKEYAGQIVRSGGVGIADQVFAEMMKLQEAGLGR